MNRIRVPGVFGTRNGSRLSHFEEGYLFRISRAVPLGLAGLASIVLLGGALVFFYTLIPPRKIREPAPATVPPEVAVSLADVRSHLSEEEPDGHPSFYGETETAPVTTTPRTDSTWLALARKVHAIRALFPAPTYSWTDRYESYCADLYMGYCFRTDQRRVAEGVASLVLSTVRMFDTGDQEEWISVPGANEGYQLNVTDAARKVRALTELEGILRQVPVQQRREILGGWIGLRHAREAERLAQVSRENQRVASQRAAEQARYATAQLKRTTLRGSSFSWMAGAIGALWMLGLTLALLAIERNTRHLRAASRNTSAPPVQGSGSDARAVASAAE